MSNAIKDRFDRLEPEKKQRVVVSLVVGGVLLAITALVLVNNKPVPKKKDASPQAIGNVLLRDNPREMGLTDVANAQRDQNKEIADLKAELARLQGQGKGGRDDVNPSSPDAALRGLSGAVDREQADLDADAPPGTSLNAERPATRQFIAPDTSLTRPNSGAAQQPPAPPPAPAAPQIQTINQGGTSATSSVAKATAAKPPVPPVYLPTGTMITGTLINGLDAPTGRAAQNAPIPVLVRVKREAILPSRYSSDVREAFILAAGYGDLSSERAYLRASRLSMILRNGQTIDIPIKMTAVGSDAKAGLRGRVVSKQGGIIAKALMAGLADGISRAFSNSYSLAGSGGGMPSASDVGDSAAAGGASTALDRVASYFLSRADEMYPVVEVDGGRQVTLVLLEGVDLAPRQPDEKVASTSTPEKQG